MLIKKGKFYYYYLENKEVEFEIVDWELPFGLEKFGKKTIVNLHVPKNNNGMNLLNTIKQISEEILKEENSFAQTPVKDNGGYTLLRCEYQGKKAFEKNSKISTVLYFKIYNFKGNWGISVIIK